jgi:hypothetical protein
MGNAFHRPAAYRSLADARIAGTFVRAAAKAARQVPGRPASRPGGRRGKLGQVMQRVGDDAARRNSPVVWAEPVPPLPGGVFRG